jgi:hypothetical protein
MRPRAISSTLPRLALILSATALLFSGCATAPTPGGPVPPATPVAASQPTIPTPTPVTPPTPDPDPIPVPGQKSVPNLAPPPAAPNASAPAPASPAALPGKPATIVGFEESSTMLDNLTVFVVSVDGFRLSAGRSGWNIPISIKPGPRHIVAEFNRGVFAGRADLVLNAKPETAYQLKFATDAQLFGKNSFCEFWIEEANSGEKALLPVRAALVRVEPAK